MTSQWTLLAESHTIFLAFRSAASSSWSVGGSSFLVGYSSSFGEVTGVGDEMELGILGDAVIFGASVLNDLIMTPP